MLGDLISSALSSIGITEEKISGWLGHPCGCEERRQKLNALHAWAKRIMGGKVTDARELLEHLTEED